MQVGDWKFEAAANELLRGGEHIKLEPQCALVLQYLCNHAGEVVSRDELLDAVWGREAVSVQSVPVVISKLRSLLGDNKRQPEYIETVTKRGYRLIAHVGESLETDRQSSQRFKPGLRVSLLILAGLSSLGVVFASNLLKSPHQSPRVLYVADVANLTNDDSLNVVAAGASEILSMELARAEGLKVTRLRRDPIDNQWVNPNLRASEFSSIPLLTASVILSENGKSIVMQLVDGDERRVVWTHNFAIKDSAFAAGQRQAAYKLFEYLGVRENANLETIPSKAPGVEELYLRAKFFWGLRGRENNIMAADLVRQALETDPEYVPAHALIAEIYAKYSAEYLDVEPVDTKELATHHLDYAIAADPFHPATLAAQTRQLMLLDRRPDQALEVAERAINLGLDDSMIHLQRAASLYLLGRIDEALASIDRAMELEYGSPYVKVQYILSNYLGARFQEVIVVAEEMEPEYFDDFRAQVAASYYEVGLHDRAMQTWFDALKSAGIEVGIKQELIRLIEQGNISAAYQALSEYVEVESNPETLQVQILQLYWSFYYGDERLPLMRLKSIPIDRHARFLLWLHRWPLFDRFKEEPEFQDYLKNVGVAKVSNCAHPSCSAS